MPEVSDVLSCLKDYADTEGYTDAQLQSFCERGLDWVKERLRPGTDEKSPLIIQAAAAVAHYRLFFTRLTETDRYESYTAGDMNVRRNIEREMSFERQARDEVIASAAAVLRDGGFYFRGN